MGNSIRYWRKMRGITQKQLAEKVGIHRPVLSIIENEAGVRPTNDILLAIARELGVLITDLVPERELYFNEANYRKGGGDDRNQMDKTIY